MPARLVSAVLSRRFVRRTLRPLVCVACAMVVLTGCDWLNFRYGPARTGYNPTENKVNVTNVGNLTELFTTGTGLSVLSSPAVANGIVYFTSEDKHVYAVDAAGNSGCSGVPRTCAPLWTAALADGSTSSPAVANGVVYVTSDDGTLAAFDAAGTMGCSGTPTTCTPLWTAHIGTASFPSPVVVNGVLYIAASGSPVGDATLAAFDAAGVTGCGGTPKTCTPLWTADLGSGDTASSPAVANGMVYVANTDGVLMAFDAAGNTDCSGIPTACTPLWTATLFGRTLASPAVAGGMVFITTTFGKVEAFDATGSAGCSGTPKVCSPLWTSELIGGAARDSSPAVAHGVVYAGAFDGKLYAYDASGSTGCTGVPKTCTPLWTAETTADSPVESSPAVANGVVYVGSNDDKLYAFDAAGTIGCSGVPKTCTPLWTATTGGDVFSSPAVANGRIYVGSFDNRLYTYRLSP